MAAIAKQFATLPAANERRRRIPLGGYAGI